MDLGTSVTPAPHPPATSSATDLRAAPPAVPGAGGTARPAARLRRPGWRDPRLWVGVALVAASVLLGARVLAGADRTVAVWAAADDLPAGSSLDPTDLEAAQVRFADAGDLDAYLPADQPLPDGVVLRRTVGPGELVPRSALGPADQADTVEVPVAVAPEQVPGSVRAGSVVDVYLLGQRRGGPALAGVTVLDASLPEEELAVSGTRRLVLAVPSQDAPAFLQALGAQDQPRVTVVRER